jgi:alpha-tubulin suppressor-like RCC1 family protein
MVTSMSDFYIKKRIDQITGVDYDRKEVVSAPLWSHGNIELNKIYVNDNQPHHQKIYYRSIYSDSKNTSSLDSEFSISYGNIYNSGSSTGSYGLISGSVSESSAIYSMYRNLLSDYDTVNNFSSGSFIFKGIGLRNNAVYIWGNNIFYSPPKEILSPNRLYIPGVKNYKFNSMKSISVNGNEYYPGGVFYINVEGKLFRTFGNESTQQIGNDTDWKQVSCGQTHILLLKEDGTLWSYGSNFNGELGLGFSRYDNSIEYSLPQKIGLDNDWKMIKAGYACSFAIKENGELYSWGANTKGVLGLGDTEQRDSPTKIGNDWKYITVNFTDDLSGRTAFAIKTDETLWGWGDSNSAKLGEFVPIGPPILTPTQVSSDSWIDISVGKCFAVGIKINGYMYSWGENTSDGVLGLGTNGVIAFTQPQQIGTDNDWTDIECGYEYSLALKSNKTLWGWGSNSNNQQGRGPNAPGGSIPTYYAPTRIGTNSGWKQIASSQYFSAGSIDYETDKKELYSSEDIYVINVDRKNFRDRVDSGTWELSFAAVSFNPSNKLVADTSSIITIVDETVDLIGTTDEYPSRIPYNLGNTYYGVYSGSIKDGIHPSAASIPYGVFYPQRGLILLNGEALLKSGSICTLRTPPTSSGAIPKSSNADILYTAISGAMSGGKPFIGRTIEVMDPTYYFLRIENEEFNNTFNPTYFIDPINFIVKDKLKSLGYPFTYITTIGLYNDEDDLLAVAKLSRPILKTPSTELVVKVKLDI